MGTPVLPEHPNTQPRRATEQTEPNTCDGHEGRKQNTGTERLWQAGTPTLGDHIVQQLAERRRDQVSGKVYFVAVEAAVML